MVDLPLRPARMGERLLAFVHQDLGLIHSLSVTENVRIAELAGIVVAVHLLGAEASTGAYRARPLRP